MGARNVTFFAGFGAQLRAGPILPKPYRPRSKACTAAPHPRHEGSAIAMSNEDYVYDEASGEWVSAGDAATPAAQAVEVRDSVGNLLADGDSVTLIKDLKVKGANQTLKRGTLIKSIRLTGDQQEIDCRYEGIKGLVLRAEFVRKR
jgi:protein PhnA